MGNEDVTESPIELLRQLIEKSGKWTEGLVVYVRLILVHLSLFLALFIYWMYRWITDSLSRGQSILLPVAFTVVLVGYCAYVLVKVIRRYRSHVAQRNRWRRKFEVLKKKEEEIERLLSEGAD